MSRLQADPVYEVTGVEWFPSLPVGWSSSKLKYIATCLSGGTPDTAVDDYWLMDDTGVPWVAIGDMSGRQVVSSTSKSLSDDALASKSLPIGEPGMLLFAMYASVGEVTPLGIAAAWNQALLGIKARPMADTRFIYYALKSVREWLPALYRSNTQNNLNAEQVGNFDIPLPPLASQKAIAEYLDRETIQIDDLIIKQERLIELLAEKRQAIIAHAITKGLDPSAHTKPSGIPWLGDIPSHWTEKPMCHFMTGRVDYRGATPKKTDDGIFLVTAKNVRKGYIDYAASTEYVGVDDYDNVMSRGRPALGDILMTMEAPLGNFALVDDPGVALAQRVIKFRPKAELIPEFSVYAMNSPYFQAQLEERATGSTALGLKASKLIELRLVAPSIAEQQRIVDYLDSGTGRIDALARRSETVVKLLSERRSALISAAVTGQINVQERVGTP